MAGAGASDPTLYPADGALSSTRPLLAGSASFTGDPSGFLAPQSTGGVDFATAPMAADTVLAINPELRERLDTVTPVVPTVPMKMQPPAMAMAHSLRQGHRLVLRVTASDPDKVPTFAVDPRITVYTGPGGTVLRVPKVSNPTLVADTVPFEVLPKKPGDAQSTIRAPVTPPLPGAGVRQIGVTSEHIAFTVEAGKDNNRLVVGAVPALPADIDLYLEKRQADGSWVAVTYGGSAELTHEGFTLAQPPTVTTGSRCTTGPAHPPRASM